MAWLALSGMLWVAAHTASPAESHEPPRRIVRVDALPPARADEEVGARMVAAVRAGAHRSRLGLVLDDGGKIHGRTRIAARPDLVHTDIVAEYAGVPLLHPVARALVDPQVGRAVVAYARPVPPLRDPDLRPSIDEDEALARLSASRLPGAVRAEHAELVVDPRGPRSRLVWRIDPPADLHGGTNPVFVVDATTGAVERLYDQARFARARAFLRNPVLDPHAGEYPLHEVDPDAPFLSGPVFSAANCLDGGKTSCDPEPTASPTNPAGDFLYPAPEVGVAREQVQPTDTFAEVSIYYHADKFTRWLKAHGFEGLRCTLQGEKATLVANFHTVDDRGWVPFDNAFFSGACDSLLVFGQGSEVDFAYDGDVVYHEVGHGVVQAQMEGGFLGLEHGRADAWVVDAGALNEAFADFLSSAFAGDPVVGDYVGAYWSAVSGPGIRNNDNDFRCPDALVGEVHVDSEVFAGALWDGVVALGEETMVPLVLDTIALLPSDATFEEAARLLVEVAQLQGGDARAREIRDLLEPRGLLACRRVLPVDNTLRERLFVQPPGDVEPFAPPPLQLTVDVPPDANAIDLYFTVDGYAGPLGDEGSVAAGLMAKTGSPIEFRYARDQRPWRVEADADHVLEDLDGRARIPAEPGTTVYLAFFNTGDTVMTIDDIAVELDRGSTHSDDDGGIDPDLAEPTGDATGDGGCTLRSEGSSGAPSLLLLALAIPFHRARRSRR